MAAIFLSRPLASLIVESGEKPAKFAVGLHGLRENHPKVAGSATDGIVDVGRRTLVHEAVAEPMVADARAEPIVVDRVRSLVLTPPELFAELGQDNRLQRFATIVLHVFPLSWTTRNLPAANRPVKKSDNSPLISIPHLHDNK
ncbi:MAG: hypothetical protein LiPW15_468 [Parcubacteria group bacterium LiPW_15]|nr:MAG: hypothetical protein LiPW15_468 [Parcubacteria group bacterium LiPW_15]